MRGREGSLGSSAKDNEEEDASETSSPPPPAATMMEGKKRACQDEHDHRLEFSDVLLARLSEIRASALGFVDMKRLHSTDVRDDQNRLQFSGRSPISKIFITNAEKARVRSSDGMPVTAFDHRGQRYEMTCKLWRDKHYRFMGPGWKNFRQTHHLTIDKDARLTRRVTVKVWSFRSRALLREVKDDGGDGEEEDGALGLVLLLVDEGEQQEDEVAAGEEEVVVAPAPARDESCATKFLELRGAVALWLLWTSRD